MRVLFVHNGSVWLGSELLACASTTQTDAPKKMTVQANWLSPCVILPITTDHHANTHHQGQNSLHYIM